MKTNLSIFFYYIIFHWIFLKVRSRKGEKEKGRKQLFLPLLEYILYMPLAGEPKNISQRSPKRGGPCTFIGHKYKFLVVIYFVKSCKI